MYKKKELFFYHRTLKHIAKVTKNVLNVIENSSIPNKYNVDVLILLKNVKDHDRTKFKEPQFSKYVEISWYYYKKFKGENYPLNKVFSSNATILHIISEPHHPEYWDETFLTTPGKFNISNRDGLPEVPVDATKMPNESIIEMVCDWAAVAQERNSSLKDWADKTVSKRWKFTESQVKLIYNLVNFLESCN